MLFAELRTTIGDQQVLGINDWDPLLSIAT